MTGNDKDRAPVVVLAGVGAAGMAIAQEMPGEAALVLVDHDIVKQRNLRCSPLLSEDDIDQPKVRAAAMKLQARRAPVFPVAGAVQALRAGVWRLADLAIAASDNRLADVSWSWFCQAAGTPHMVSAKLEGGDSRMGRLRFFTPGQGCELCWWSESEFAELARLGRSCAAPPASGPSITDGAGSRLLAQALAAEIVQPILAGQTPALAPGSELRLLDEDRRLVLHARPKADCPGLHGPVPLEAALEGEVSSYGVHNLIGDLDCALGRGWRWHMPAEMAGGVLAQRAGMAPSAADLQPMSDHLLAHLWPPGDLVRVERASGAQVWIGLPLGGLFNWLAKHITGGHSW